MGMNKEMDLQSFLKAQEEKRQQSLANLGKQAKAWGEAVRTQGVLLEYHAENDYLYMLVGGSVQEGIAVQYSAMSVMVDPETSLPFGIEVPFFMEKLKKGDLPGEPWERIRDLVIRHNHVFLPPIDDALTGRGIVEDLLAAV